MTHTESEIIVIGAGIVGLATARALQRQHPGAVVTVFDKETSVAAHQTGRNSGVIHSGLYYPPSSQKAAMVKTGRELLFDFINEQEIPVDLCGKVVVATRPDEVTRLDGLKARGLEHGLAVRSISLGELRDREPFVQGLAALVVPEAGITDYVMICERLADSIVAAGGWLELGSQVTAINEEADHVSVVTASTGGRETTTRAKWLVNCSGLHSDRIAQLSGRQTEARIMPFRGEYYELTPQSRSLVKHLVYPVPDPRFPFLGVHFTRMINGEIHAGPNAVLALAREGYTWRQANRVDLLEMAKDPGSWKLFKKYWRTGMGEMHRSLSKAAFVTALQQLVPEVTATDLVKSGAGIRAQALRRDGSLVDDFEFVEGARSVHVVNAPSPAATASLAIGEAIATRLGKKF